MDLNFREHRIRDDPYDRAITEDGHRTIYAARAGAAVGLETGSYTPVELQPQYQHQQQPQWQRSWPPEREGLWRKDGRERLNHHEDAEPGTYEM